MSKPRNRGDANWFWWKIVAGVAMTVVGCQPDAVPSKPGPDSVPSQVPAGPSKSKATDAAPPKNGSSATTEKKEPSGESAAKEAGADSATPSATTDAEKPQASKPSVRPVARRPSAPGEPLEISFDDLVIGMQADVVFRPWMMTDRAKEVEGQTVRLVGYIHPGVDKQKHIKELVLLRNLECKFGPGGQADHLVMVKFKTGVEATFTKNAVEVQGILKVNPYLGADGNTWSIYDLEGIAFKDLRRK